MKANDTQAIETTTTRRNKRQKGVTTVEYAVMLVLVALAVATFGDGINQAVMGVFGDVETALD